MALHNLPAVTSVEVVATRAEPADRKRIEYIETKEGASIGRVCYVVKIAFDEMPPISSQGFDLYLDDYHVPRYWSFPAGIYFKVYNPRFFAKHGGAEIRLTVAGGESVGSGVRLPVETPESAARTAARYARPASRLPTQAEVLGGQQPSR